MTQEVKQPGNKENFLLLYMKPGNKKYTVEFFPSVDEANERAKQIYSQVEDNMKIFELLGEVNIVKSVEWKPLSKKVKG